MLKEPKRIIAEEPQSLDRWLREIFPFTEMHKNIKMNQFILSVQYCIAPFLVLRRVKTI